jgi:hypothetical protein
MSSSIFGKLTFESTGLYTIVLLDRLGEYAIDEAIAKSPFGRGGAKIYYTHCGGYRRKTMKRNALVVCIFLAALSPLASQGWDANLPGTLDKMAENYYQPTVQTVFGNFTYAYSGLPSPFARWLEDDLAAAMTRSTRLRFLNTKAAAAMDPLFAKTYGDFFAAVDGAAFLHGSYFDEGDSVRVRLELTGFSDKTLIGVSEIRVPSGSIPQGIAVDPSKAVVQAANDLGRLLPSATAGGLSVSVATERGAGAVYRSGEDMVIFATASKDVYAKVYHVDSGGSVKLIWPNQFGGSGRIAAGQTVRIPAPGDTFRFLMGPPFGTEFIKLVASTAPFARNEEDFADLGKDARGVITRGIEIRPTAGAPERAEALASYVIMGAR